MLLWPAVPIYEPFQAPEYYVENIALEWAPNGNIRAFCCADETQIDMMGRPVHRIVKVKLLGSPSMIPTIIAQLAQAMLEGPPQIHRGYGGPTLVK